MGKETKLRKMKELKMAKIAYAFVLTGFLAAALGLGKGTEDVSRMSKDEYIQHVESKLREWDATIASMKGRRDNLSANHDRQRAVDKSVSTMEQETRDIRDDLKNLRASASPDWMTHQSKIEKNFDDLRNAKDKSGLAE